MKSSKESTKNDNKKWVIIMLLLLLIVVISGSYAYFTAQRGKGADAEITATSGTTDSLTFNAQDMINIYADMDNFGKDDGNQEDEAIVTATLVPNNTTNKASEEYNVYLVVDKNELIYTTDEKTPELIMEVTKPDETKENNINGLEYKEDTQTFDITQAQNSYKIATNYKIDANEETKVDTWKFKVTLVNLGTDQNKNAGREFRAHIVITKGDLDSYVAPVIKSLTPEITHESIKVSLEITPGSSDIVKYFYAYKEKDTGDFDYQESNENNYTFSGLSDETEYEISAYAQDSDGGTSNTYTTTLKTSDVKPPNIEGVTHKATLNTITVDVSASKGTGEITSYTYTISGDGIDGEQTATENSNTHTFEGLSENKTYNIKVVVKDSNEKESTPYTIDAKTLEIFDVSKACTASDKLSECIIKLNDKGTYEQTGIINHTSKVLNSAEDGSYRFMGSDPNNYICFEDTCDFSHLYRIIGVFGDQVKVIKADYLSQDDLGLTSLDTITGIKSLWVNYRGVQETIYTYDWSGKSVNYNNDWSQSDLKKYLNDSYYNKLPFKELISITKWNTNGGNEREIIESNVHTAYKYEIGGYNRVTTYSDYIGLMYVSDYYYAANPEYWILKGNNYNDAKFSDWLYLGFRDHTITKNTKDNRDSYVIDYTGEVMSYGTGKSQYPIRPAFYLNNSVTYQSGDGSKTSPIKVS